MLEMTKKLEIPEIAMRIKQLRNDRGWTQSVLAFHAKVTDGAVKMWETGKRFPRGKNLKNLAEALKCTESDILEGFDVKRPISKKKEKSKAELITKIVTALPALDYSQLDSISLAIDAFSGNLDGLGDLESEASGTD